MDGRRWCLVFIFAVIELTVADYAGYADYVKQQANNETFVRLFTEHAKLYEDTVPRQPTIDFHCPQFPPPTSNPTSVHRLTPYDINVIGAVGDSMTAGTGIMAITVLGLLNEYRGLSWCIGGANTITETKTVANALKVYNPSITGFSTGTAPVENEGVSRFNVANPGDKSEHMYDQAVLLVNRMKADTSIDFMNDWKIVTMFIGGNDLCAYCEDKAKYDAKAYIGRVQSALDYLHANLPRAFVNLVDVIDIAMLSKLNQNLVCDVLHLWKCKCAAYPANGDAERELKAEIKKYWDATAALVDSGRYETKDDFTVVLQPFFTETVLPLKAGSDKPDLSYFSPDCFHLGLKGQEAAAEALWNNMVEPVGKKRTSWTPGELVECPSASAPYFYTKKNSQSSFWMDDNRTHVP